MEEEVFWYVNSEGRSLQFGGDSPYWIEGSSLRGFKRRYTESGGAISSNANEPYEQTFRIVHEREHEEGRGPDELFRIALVDARANEPGRITDGESYARCLLVKGEDAYDDSFMQIEDQYDVTFLFVDGCWTCERSGEAVPVEDESGLDYPHDYPFDFAVTETMGLIENRSGVPAPMKLSVTGPATDWYVRVADTVYRASKDLQEGEMFVIDGREGTASFRDALGNVENAFHLLSGDFWEGSGSYAFEQVPAGTSNAAWSGCEGFSYVIYETYDERPWSR